MDSDIPLKVAFRVRTKDLLPLTELAARFGRPVLTTVMYLRPPAPRDLAYRHTLGGTVVNQWRFAVVRLWEQSPERLLELGPGGAALVPLSAEASLPLVAEASRMIQREAPLGQRPDLLAILYAFAEGRYTATQLARVIPEEVAMASGLFEKARVIGEAKGRAEEARQICVELAKSLHPAVADRVVPVIAGCSELTRLRQWALRASRLSDVEFVRLVAGRASARSSRGRTPRPARRSTRPARSRRSVR